MKFKFYKEPVIIALGLGAMCGVIYWAHTMKVQELASVAPILQRTENLEKELKQIKDELKELKEKQIEVPVLSQEKIELPEKTLSPSEGDNQKGYCPIWSWEPYYSYKCWLYYNYYANN